MKTNSKKDSIDCADFSDEIILPCQYVDMLRRGHNDNGERRLLWAVLEDAIVCYLNNANARDARRRRLFLEARQWFHAHRMAGLFSYHGLCEALGIEPFALRAALERAVERRKRSKDRTMLRCGRPPVRHLRVVAAT